MGMKSKMAENGPNIIIGGLVIQVLFFGFFMISSAVFHMRMHRDPTPYSLSIPLRWSEIIYVLYAASLLILVRSIFRLIEYAQGNDGYLISHEVFLYIFDALLMFATMLVFHVVHPSELNVWLKGKGMYTRGIKVQKFVGSGEVFS